MIQKRNPIKKKLAAQRYYIKNRESIRQYRNKNKDRIREYEKKRAHTKYAYAKEYHLRTKKTVFDHYGNRCACCGESTREFLSIDHINGGGNKHREKIGGGSNIYRWLINNNFPDEFQILCFNCNLSKGFYGQCPHQRKL